MAKQQHTKMQLQQQTINLQEGWNYISLNVIPNDLDMLMILKPLIDEETLLKVWDKTFFERVC